jgi:hypothetical protein
LPFSSAAATPKVMQAAAISSAVCSMMTRPDVLLSMIVLRSPEKTTMVGRVGTSILADAAAQRSLPSRRDSLYLP